MIGFEVPATEAALYDLLQGLFGIGEYDESDTTPWFKARGTEIAKLRAQMRRRRLSIEDLTIAAWYADSQRTPIVGVWQLCNLVTIARRAHREAVRAAEPTLREELDAAARTAYEQGEPGWADRLSRADLSTGALVLADWDMWTSGGYS